MTNVYDSLKNENQFRFVCPTFGAETRMGACVQLREAVYGGARPSVRKGCQAAMICGKCPAAEMVSKYCFDKNWTNDHHGSSVPKLGKLMRPLLEKIRRVLMRDSVLEEYKVPENERLLLESANDRIDEQLKTAPGEASRLGTSFETAPTTRRRAPKAEKKPEVDNSAINQAAMTGDIAAAINA